MSCTLRVGRMWQIVGASIVVEDVELARRETKYPARLVTHVTAKRKQSLVTAGNRYDKALGAIVRDAIEFGAKQAVDKARKEAAELAALATPKPSPKKGKAKGKETEGGQ